MKVHKQQASVIWLALAGLLSCVVQGCNCRIEESQAGKLESQDNIQDDASLQLNIDALNPSICGNANFRKWQTEESAFGCSKTPPRHRESLMHGLSERDDDDDDARIIKPRILNGQDAIEGEFPFYVRFNKQERGKVVCGGTLIHNNLVLTTVHCMQEVMNNYFSIVLTFGTNWRDDTKDAVRRFSVKWLWPKEYRKRLGRYDMAVMVLNDPVDYVPFKISPACLWPRAERRSSQSTCAVAGFGDSTFGGHSHSVLQTQELISTCHYGGNLSCYTSKTSDTDFAFVGDIGGPLVCYDRCPEHAGVNNSSGTVKAFVVGGFVESRESGPYNSKNLSYDNLFVDYVKPIEDLIELIRFAQSDEIGTCGTHKKFVCATHRM